MSLSMRMTLNIYSFLLVDCRWYQVDTLIQDIPDNIVITPSASPWYGPPSQYLHQTDHVPVIDCRRLNAVTVPGRYPDPVSSGLQPTG